MFDYDVGLKDDPNSFSQAMRGENCTSWYNVMKEEMESIAKNKVWDLIELPKKVSIVGWKWVFKTKKDSMDNTEWYKVRILAKGFTQKESIDNYEIFSPVLK